MRYAQKRLTDLLQHCLEN